MNKIFFSFFMFFTVFTVSFSFAQVDQAYKNKVKQMMQSSGGIEAYDAAISQLFTMYKQQSPEVPEKFWNEFEKEFSSTSMDELVSLLAPVYYRHLTAQDLDKIIAFYATPAGKKLSGSCTMFEECQVQGVGQVKSFFSRQGILH
jgi:hypothetical protein